MARKICAEMWVSAFRPMTQVLGAASCFVILTALTGFGGSTRSRRSRSDRSVPYPRALLRCADGSGERTFEVMMSPFPGFDPYLEESWGDVHQTLAIYARNAIQPQLPKDLRARAEERVYVAYEGIIGRRAIVPDVGVSERSQRGE